MSKTLIVETPAKINLWLRLLARRPDGYHELDTAFQAIDLWDRLTLRRAHDLTLECDLPGLAVDDSNLVLRAAKKLQGLTGCQQGAAIKLNKRIPVQGGLGGGSSNAAGALLGCVRLWGLDVAPAVLRKIARELGADVPFFLHGGTAHGSARGDVIRTLPRFENDAILLGVPPFGVATSEVFKSASEWLTLPRDNVNFSALFGQLGSHPPVYDGLENDLQQGVFELRPELGRFHTALLEAGASAALMSGSGSTVFGLFDTPARRDEAADELAGRFAWRLLSARTVAGGIRLRVTD